MKSTALFFIICLLTSVFSSKTEFSSLESSKLGRNLLDILQIQIASKEPVQTLLNMLNEMSDNLNNDQAAADAVHQTFQEQCVADESFYSGEITESESRIDAAKNQLAALKPQLTDAEEGLAGQRASLVSLQEQLNQASSQRVTEAEEYTLKVQEHESALSMLHEASGLFQGLLAPEAGAAFLQKKNAVFAQVSSTIRNGLSKIRKGYKGIFRILAQITEKAPIQAKQETVQKIIDLIKKIRENVEASYQAEKQAESDRVDAFNVLSENLSTSITNANANINNYVNTIATLQSSIASQEEELSAQETRLESRTSQLAERQKVCETESTAYGIDRVNRSEEISIVRQVIDIVATKLSNLKEYIKERVSTVA